MHPGGWTSAARFAGAEPLLTGRTRIYDESTLRRAADQLDAEGCSARLAHAIWNQVDGAVRAADEPVIAYTDVFDQPYYRPCVEARATSPRAAAQPLSQD